MDAEKQERLNEMMQEAVDGFLRQLDGHRNSFPVLMNALVAQTKMNMRHIDKFMKENDLVEQLKNADDSLQVSPNIHNEFISQVHNLESSQFAVRNMARSAVISMVCSYDALIGNLIRIIYQANEEGVKALNVEIPLAEIISFTNIEDVRTYVIEKQVETVLRKSHEEQLDWLSKRIGVETLKKFEHFKDFVEIMERRNLFVHSDGVVSRQYIEQCVKAGMEVAAKEGEMLNADYAYVKKCYDIIAETGVKVSQVIWRKLNLGLETCDEVMQDITYNYLRRGQYDLANNLLKFAMEPPIKHIDSEYEWIFRVNFALSYYLADHKEESDKIVQSKDWAALDSRFRLAEAVLLEKYDVAQTIMKQIGADEQFMSNYQQWPLFRKYRHTENFKQTYEEIYGVPFLYQEQKKSGWKEFLQEAQQIMTEEETETKEKP